MGSDKVIYFRKTFFYSLDQIVRMVELLGIEHVGIGTDMDGNYQPVMTAYDQFAAIEGGLEVRGLGEEELGFDFDGWVRISAKADCGIDELIDEIRKVLGIADFDLTQPVCFTDRQRRLLSSLGQAKDKRQAKSLITELCGPENE